MGQTYSTEPVVEKETERAQDDRFTVAVSSCQGWRISQEDSHNLELSLPGKHKAAFFAVFDGHGSGKISEYAAENFWRHLIENQNYIDGNFKLALEQSFVSFDELHLRANFDAHLIGSTAVTLLVVDDKVYCANIGDSRGVACVNSKCIPLSFDHKPENPQEIKRIINAGGYVMGNRVNGNLALSRAFGDFHYKSKRELCVGDQIVSPEPDVTVLDLNDDVDFLLLACDGIWDVLSNEQVVEFVISQLRLTNGPGLICEELITRCLATDCELMIGCDNMTVLLICHTRNRSWEDYCRDVCAKTGDSRMPTSADARDSAGDSSASDNVGDSTSVASNATLSDEQTNSTTTTATQPATSSEDTEQTAQEEQETQREQASTQRCNDDTAKDCERAQTTTEQKNSEGEESNTRVASEPAGAADKQADADDERVGETVSDDAHTV